MTINVAPFPRQWHFMLQTREKFSIFKYTVLQLQAAMHNIKFWFVPAITVRLQFAYYNMNMNHYYIIIIITRHSLVERRARYLVYCMFVCLFVNDFSTTRGPIHAIFCMRA